MGPTASGKTRLAVRLAASFGLEIVSVDSAQVYRHMDIGTAKPGNETLAAAPHHLIDILDPSERYSAARFCEDAARVMAEIHARGNIPLLVGGTMLYFKALREGLSELPPADAITRLVIDSMAQTSGWPALHAELGRVDPATAARVRPTDAQRIQRALEVYYLTGQPLSALIARGRPGGPSYRMIPIALEPSNRAVLHQRIEQRFEVMLELGLIEEVRRLRERFELDASLPSMRAAGYRQVWQYLEGEFGLCGLREKGVAATRQLAKRQLTWLRPWASAQRFDCLAQGLTEQVATHIAEQLR
ncbi:MAG TPA: tRNA (adenosine(37)-N6)-dimethylallyltransferase MiaA [Burkholderiales bacterium]|nr:tRNA (adenosine(37)-N6)-dimethylallyltransferase MiaA [Burkholderiales bacterium]